MAGLLLSLGLLPLGDLMETNIKLVRNGPFFAGVMCCVRAPSGCLALVRIVEPNCRIWLQNANLIKSMGDFLSPLR